MERSKSSLREKLGNVVRFAAIGLGVAAVASEVKDCVGFRSDIHHNSAARCAQLRDGEDLRSGDYKVMHRHGVEVPFNGWPSLPGKVNLRTMFLPDPTDIPPLTVSNTTAACEDVYGVSGVTRDSIAASVKSTMVLDGPKTPIAPKAILQELGVNGDR